MNNERQRATVIKRYKNRKLYDTQGHKYVTLLDIKNSIQEGADVMVIDSETKQNITTLTLLKLFYELQKKKLVEGEFDAMTMNSLVEAIKVM